MKQEYLDEMEPFIRHVRERVGTLADALQKLDGREVRAVCADLAIEVFKLGEAAQARSEQRWAQ